MGNTKKHFYDDNREKKIEICFTGFKQEDKNRLIEVAKQHNMFIRDSVTKNVDFICCGYNKAAEKIKKAVEQKVIFLTEKTLVIMITTGEIVDK